MARPVGPRRKVAHGRAHVERAKACIPDFIATHPYTYVREDDPRTGDLVYKVEVEPETSHSLQDLALIAGDAVHNFRSALDLLAHQLVESNNAKPTNTTAFPVWRTKGQFDGGGAGTLKGAHPAAISRLRSLKPYQGGNDRLWRLHRLDAIDKHRLLLAIGAAHTETLYTFRLFDQNKAVVLKHGAVTLKDGTEIFRVSRSARTYFDQQPNPEFSMLVTLNESVVPPGQPIVETLTDLGDCASGIINQFVEFLV